MGGGEINMPGIPILLSSNLHSMLSINLNIVNSTKFEDENIYLKYIVLALQFLLISVSLGAPVLNLAGHSSIHYLWALTGATTFLSAVSYAFMKVVVQLCLIFLLIITFYLLHFKRLKVNIQGQP